MAFLAERCVSLTARPTETSYTQLHPDQIILLDLGTNAVSFGNAATHRSTSSVLIGVLFAMISLIWSHG